MAESKKFARAWIPLCMIGYLLTPSAARASTPAAAQWIAPTGPPAASIGVFDFRKIVTLQKVPRTCVVHLTADNRFQLFVNGRRVGEGPARGDLQHWRYETLDIAPFLHGGENVIAARVWNFGDEAPSAQITLRTGFLLWTSEAGAPSLNTDASWQVRLEPGWRFEPTGPPLQTIVGPNETIDGRTYDWLWTSTDDKASWSAAVVLGPPDMVSISGPAPKASTWTLMPDPLPAMESTLQPAGRVVRSTGIAGTSFPAAPLTIPAHAHVTLLLDNGVLTTAYPQLAVAEGAGARIRLTYAEALYDAHGEKGNRNEIAGKHMDMRLRHDTFLPGGGSAARTFEPLWWRTWRYLRIDVDTDASPVTLRSLRSRFTAYPFQQRARFTSSDPELEKIWQVGWRTARVDAHATYMDCPYYEQTQYIGDTRIEALVSYVMSGDDRLARQALLAFADSVRPSGLTQSSYPVRGVQIIPPFSLLWIGMMHDFWMYRPNTAATITEMLPEVRNILEHFRKLQRSDSLLGKLPQNGFGLWNFVDWTAPWPIGAPPEDPDGGSVTLSLQFAAALQNAADLEAAMGDSARAARDRAEAGRITQTVASKAWDQRYGLLADTPARTSFSQHANILGVLTGAIPPQRQRAVLQAILQRELDPASHTITPPLASASYYFRFYLARALDRAGMSDLYLKTLGPWRNMLALGLTTWAEQPEPSRSDAHAWSSHPNFDLLTTVAGIRPDAPGFSRILIEPHLGALTSLDATMPHPKGDIHVHYLRTKGGLDATIDLPEGAEGRFEFAGTERRLHGGHQHLRIATP